MLMSRLTVGFLTLVATVLVTACAPAETTSTTGSQPTPAASVEPDTSAATPQPETPEVSQVAATKTGMFASGEHETAGGVSLVAQDGTQTLIFDESFATDNGPDLVVVLHQSANPLQETEPPAYPLNEGDYVVLEPLKSTTGTQEYVIPAEVNVADFQSVAVWCREFNATFGAASLM